MIFIKKLFTLLRISHWTKAGFVLLGVVCTEAIGYGPKAIAAALAFCLISSAVYIYNDLQDLEEDRLHPKKYRRPLASKEVTVSFALWALSILLILGLLISIAVSTKLAAILGLYLLINLVYNHWLRDVPIFDVLCITSGFMLRIFAGTVGIGLPITGWLILTATLFSLYMAFSKRRLEMKLRLLQSPRAVLSKYHPKFLNFLIMGTAILTFSAYFLYITYPRNESFYFLLTIPFAAFGLGRFTALTSKLNDLDNDDPVSLFLSDSLSRVNFVCFLVLTVMALGK